MDARYERMLTISRKLVDLLRYLAIAIFNKPLLTEVSFNRCNSSASPKRTRDAERNKVHPTFHFPRFKF